MSTTVRAPSVAIVIPCYKTELDPFERLSWDRVWQLYGHLPIVMIAPPDLDVSGYAASHPSLKVERFQFGTVREYSQLLLDRAFYERFRDRDFILIHQLDSYLLKDELAEWCRQDFDYIGAPLFHGYEPSQPEGELWTVGNGGFSLRKVEAAIEVLSSSRRYRSPAQHWAAGLPESRTGIRERLCWLGEAVLKVTRFHNDVRWATLCNFHEDVFWSIEAAHFLPGFRVPDVATGLRFAFDFAPAYCYKAAGLTLPFGCHAWRKHDPGFWRRFIPVSEP